MASSSSPPAKRRQSGKGRPPGERRPSGTAHPPGKVGSPTKGARPGTGGPPGQERRADGAGPFGQDLGRGSGPVYIYGRNPVREALRGIRKVKRLLLVAGEVGDALERQVAVWLTAGTAGASRPCVPLQRLGAAGLTDLLGTDEHQGIAAEVQAYPYLELTDLLSSRTILVALDGVQDPHNLGAIIRTAEGAGAGVLIPRHRAAEITAAVVKASAGATEHAAVAQVRNLADALKEAKEAGFWIYGAAAGAGSAYTAQDYTYPTCFVMGAEGEGLGRRVAEMCDVMVSLPLRGTMESLNVSVSTGILLYEAVRQREVAS